MDVGEGVEYRLIHTRIRGGGLQATNTASTYNIMGLIITAHNDGHGIVKTNSPQMRKGNFWV